MEQAADNSRAPLAAERPPGAGAENQIEALAARALFVAQQAANVVVSEAHVEAERLMSEARAGVERMWSQAASGLTASVAGRDVAERDVAERELVAVRSSAQADAGRIRADAESEAEGIRADAHRIFQKLEREGRIEAQRILDEAHASAEVIVQDALDKRAKLLAEAEGAQALRQTPAAADDGALDALHREIEALSAQVDALETAQAPVIHMPAPTRFENPFVERVVASSLSDRVIATPLHHRAETPPPTRDLRSERADAPQSSAEWTDAPEPATEPQPGTDGRRGGISTIPLDAVLPVVGIVLVLVVVLAWLG